MYIGNLHVQHLQSALMLFEAGKPVLCEKPMTTSPRNAAAMIQAAKEKNTFLMEVSDLNLKVQIWKGLIIHTLVIDWMPLCV